MKIQSPDECWPWQGFIGKDGYGRLSSYRKSIGEQLAHRIAWALTHGAIPDGLDALHTCDVRHCCNLGHLFLGTQDDNMKDKVRKDRQAKGENNGNSSLTEEQVLGIKKRLTSGETVYRVRTELKMDRNTVRNIKTEKTWKHLK